MKPPRAARGSVIAVAVALAAAAAALGFVIGSAGSPAHTGAPDRTAAQLVPAPAPAGWHRLALPNGAAVLFYPPTMHPVSGDHGTVSAVRFGPDGRYLLYLNATPRQGGESLRNWARYRLLVLRSDQAVRPAWRPRPRASRFSAAPDPASSTTT